MQEKDITTQELLRERHISKEVEKLMGVGFWLWDLKESRCVRCDAQVAALYDIVMNSPDEMPKMREHVMHMLAEEDRPMVKENHENLLMHGTPFDMQYRVIRQDNSIRWIEEHGRSWTEEETGKRYAFGALQDVTESHEREDSLRLERDIAEEARKAKTEFLAHMSHELRTPLNAVIGYAELIANETFGAIDNPRYKEYVDNIFVSGKLLLTLINDLLDMSANEAGKLEIAPQPVNMAPIILETLEILTPAAQNKEIDLRWDPDIAALDLVIDERRMGQVLLNLINNAIKFTPKGGNIRILSKKDPAGRPCIIIKDTGIGMTKDEIKQAIIPFQQIKDVRLKGVEGTGIGLPLSKKLVEKHGGELLIESEKEKGTTITVALPASCLS